jgi:LPLT family lysophospholipid transporter-like MFS transporter
VQNCNESLASLLLLAIYGGLLYLDAPLLPMIVGFGVFVSVAMMLIILYLAGQRANVTAGRDGHGPSLN